MRLHGVVRVDTATGECLLDDLHIESHIIGLRDIQPDARLLPRWEVNRLGKRHRVVGGTCIIGIEEGAVTTDRAKQLRVAEANFKSPEAAARNTANRPTLAIIPGAEV